MYIFSNLQIYTKLQYVTLTQELFAIVLPYIKRNSGIFDSKTEEAWKELINYIVKVITAATDFMDNEGK